MKLLAVLLLLGFAHASAADAPPVRTFLVGDSTLLPITPAASATATLAARPAPIRPDLPSIPDRAFDVKTHGAVGDGTANDTAAFQAAVDAAAKAGGGIVNVPAGTYLCGPFRLASRLNLHLAAGANLRMLPLDKYPGGTKQPDNFISGTGLHDVAITGAGTIDGQGEAWWPFAKVKGANRPRMIRLSDCERILIEGVKLMNSPMFHIAISGRSSHVTVRGVTIRAPSSSDPVTPSHNTDACDVSGHTMLIENCDVSVGDDNFTCGGNTHDVLITHCTYGAGHGVSIGSYTNGGVSNITVVDCTFTHTDCGIRIKSDRGRGGVVHNLWYENLRMSDVQYPILIYGSYMAEGRQYRDLTRVTPEIASTYPARPMGDRTPVYRDFMFRDITATTQKGRRAGLIWGLPEAPASNIVLQNVTITADLPFGIFNAENVQLIGSTITTPDGVNKLASANAKVTVTP